MCGEDCPGSDFCRECASSMRTMDQVVDMLEFTTRVRCWSVVQYAGIAGGQVLMRFLFYIPLAKLFAILIRIL